MPYRFLNPLFHFLHILLIGFVAFAWMFPQLRGAHLALIGITFFFWFVIARWIGVGVGYCPITDWHWKIKDAYGTGRPKGTYIHHVLQNITGLTLNSDTVDKWVMLGTLVISILSLAVNLIAWWA